MKKKIHVFTGYEIVKRDDVFPSHPLHQVEYAKDVIENGAARVFCTNKLDFVTALYLYNKLFGSVDLLLYLDGELVEGLEPLYEDCNRSLTLLSEIQEKIDCFSHSEK